MEFVNKKYAVYLINQSYYYIKFILVMDKLTKGAQEDVSWCMMFVDYLILVGENKQMLEDEGSVGKYWKEMD